MIFSYCYCGNTRKQLLRHHVILCTLSCIDKTSLAQDRSFFDDFALGGIPYASILLHKFRGSKKGIPKELHVILCTLSCIDTSLALSC